MVKRIFKMLHTEISGLHEAAFLLAGFAFLSKILALVRDRFLADTFGASIDLDIYYAAFRIPDFLYVSLASLVASAVLVPFIVERLGKGDSAKNFFNSIFTLFFIAIISVSVLVFVFMPVLGSLVAPGIDGDDQTMLVLLSRIMLLSPILLGISGLFASITQTLRRFFVYALTPIFYNIGIIIGVVFLYPSFGLPGLAYGVVLGAFLHLCIQLPVLAHNGFLPRLTFRFDWIDIKEVFFLSVPRTLTLSAHHMTLLILTAVASFMNEGSITIFNFSFNIQAVPLSIIGVSYSIAAFPTLARLYSNGEKKAFITHITTATRHIIFWSLPVLVLFIVLRAQIVRTILGTGSFDWTDTRLTAAALALFVISTTAQSVMLLLVRGYYAAGITKKPLFINVLSLIFVVGSSFFFVSLFKENTFFKYFIESLLRIEYLPGSEIVMLPLAFSLGALLNGAVLWYFFSKDFNMESREIFTTLRDSFAAAIIMGFVAHQFLRVFDDILDINTLFGIFSQGLFSGILGIGAGIVVLKLIKNREIMTVEKTLKRKFWKQSPISPDQHDF